MNYEPLLLSHQQRVDGILKPLGLGISDYNFVNLWLWRHSRRIELAFEMGFLVVRLTYPDRPPVMLMPVGQEDLAALLTQIKDHCESRGEVMAFRALSETMRTDLEACWPDRFEFVHTPCHDDYLYSVQALIELKGRAYHSKKNFVNRFISTHGLDFGPIRADEEGAVIAFLERWFAKAPYASDAERQGIVDLLKQRDSFAGCSYGVLRDQERVIGFSVGEALGEKVVGIHVEKADSDYAGAYQVINQAHLQTFWSDFEVVNREEDLGIEGLKKAKLSYKPIGFVTKYNATLRG